MASPAELTVRTGRVKQARRLATRTFREQTGDFLAEGLHAVREALVHTDSVVEVFATTAATERFTDLAEAAGELWTVASDEVIDFISDTVNPQGLVARCRSIIASFEPDAFEGSYVVVCADIRDPGNAGAVIRCADAVAADAVIFTGESVDPLNPKVVRATTGSLFHLAVLTRPDTAEVLSALRGGGFQILAADGTGETGLFDGSINFSSATAWVMGNEAWGLPADLRGQADRVVAVPIYGQAESLNLAAAAAVCMYAGAAARNA